MPAIALKPGCVLFGLCELLTLAAPGDLYFKDEGGLQRPAGRLPDGASVPEGFGVISDNAHCNLWWVKLDGKVTMICVDNATAKDIQSP